MPTTIFIDLSVLTAGILFYAIAAKHVNCLLRLGLMLALLLIIGIIITDLIKMALMADVFFFQSFMG